MIIADLKIPYYAVIFTTLFTENLTDYEKTADKNGRISQAARVDT